ncbi:MAG: [protein-PII] uridylyltransferase [Alphaproteobacteria bacterium]|nr:[protein-PII] uridylyltransferase [Alphaproteobacteria bacterium]
MASKKTSEIISVESIRKGLAASWGDSDDVYSHERQSQLTEFLKDELESGKNATREKFDELEFSGMDVAYSTSHLMDTLITELYNFTFDSIYKLPKKKKEQISIVATGGYGREELAPYSDLDIMFLFASDDVKNDTEIVSMSEFILYVLWDMKLKLGHAIRTVDECIQDANDDMSIRTAMLTLRNVCGNNGLCNQVKVLYKKRFFPRKPEECHEFVEAKLNERNERHERMGKSRYVLEPDVKDGRGGLRDLHTLLWLAQYLYGIEKVTDLTSFGIIQHSAMLKFKKNYNFLMTVRCCLHYISERDDNRLTFDVQQEVARRLKYVDRPKVKGVERFMRHFYLVAKDTGGLTRIVCSVLEEQKRSKPLKPMDVVEMLLARKTLKGFTLKNGRLNILLARELHKKPVNMIKIFWVSNKHNISIHNEALKLITENLKVVRSIRNDAEANKLFLEILTSKNNPEKTLRHMNEAGVLGAFIPEFARVVAQMQYDTYHVYTTDEHTIRVISILHHIESELSSMKHEEGIDYDFSIPHRVANNIVSRNALYVAAFLHDIGKGRKSSHSEAGGETAKKLCPRLGLTDEETETVVWLVRKHLIMSNTAFSRDVYDPQTIGGYAEEVQSLERLRLLFVLTCADICAVGPGTWTGWKATLLYELFSHAKDALLGDLSASVGDARVESVKANIKEALEKSDGEIAKDDIEWFLWLGQPSYWLTYSMDNILEHFKLLKKAKGSVSSGALVLPEFGNASTEKLYFSSNKMEDGKLTEITVYTKDSYALFAKLSGAIALAGASIISAKINTLNNGMALDTFYVQTYADGSNVIQEGTAFEKVFFLRDCMYKALADGADLYAMVNEKVADYMPVGRKKIFEIARRAIAYNTVSKTHTVIEINGPDRPGLLYYVTTALSEMGLHISSAHINTFGMRAIDVFYVKDNYGMKITDEAKLETITKKLEEVLADF